MASFKECIDLALSDKRISADVARQILSAEDQNAAIDDVLGNLSRQRREGAIQAVRIHEASKNMESHPKGLYDGLTSLMTKDPTGEAGYKNVEYLGKYYEGKYHSMFAEAMSHFKTRMLGFSQDEEGLNKLVKAIYGEAIDDPQIQQIRTTMATRNRGNAKRLQRSWRRTYQRMSGGLCRSTMTLRLLRRWAWKNGRRLHTAIA